VPFWISLASTRSYILSLAHGKNLARSRSSRFSLATARSRSRFQVYSWLYRRAFIMRPSFVRVWEQCIRGPACRHAIAPTSHIMPSSHGQPPSWIWSNRSSLIGSADHENPLLVLNRKWIAWPLAELRLFEISFGHRPTDPQYKPTDVT